MDKFFHVIYNHHANRGGSERYLVALKAAMEQKSIGYAVSETREPGHASTITRELIDAGAKRIIILGGDGTVHECVNGFKVGDDVAFGVIPAGTGNDVARMLKIPERPEDVPAAIDIFLKDDARGVDLLVSNTGMQSVLFFSYGIAAQMVLDMEDFRERKKFSYYKAMISLIRRYKAAEYEVVLDGKVFCRVKADFLGVHSCIHAGGGMTLINDAVIDDGQAELFIVTYKGKIRRVLNLLAILSGKMNKQPNVQIIPVTSAVINATTNNYCCVDGEVPRFDTLDIKVIPAAVKFFRV